MKGFKGFIKQSINIQEKHIQESKIQKTYMKGTMNIHRRSKDFCDKG